jgi:hypothetical protein
VPSRAMRLARPTSPPMTKSPLPLPAPFLTVAPPPAVAGPCTQSGVLGMYATSSGCCVTLHRPQRGWSCQGTGAGLLSVGQNPLGERHEAIHAQTHLGEA